MMHFCKHCEHFHTEVMAGDGEPLDFVGTCYAKGARKEADDYCPEFKISEWAKRKEQEANA